METVAANAETILNNNQVGANQNDLPLSNNAMSALGYFCGIIAVAALLLKPYDRDKQVRFHAIQALLFQAAWAVAYIGLAIVTMILTSIASFVLGALKLYALLGVLLTIPTTISMLFSVAMLVAWIVLIVTSAQGKTVRIPVLAKYADRFVKV